MRRKVFLLIQCALLFTGAPFALAQATLPFVHPLFTSNMVLQRDAADPVWGWTTPGATVTVVVKDQNGATLQTKTAVAGADKRWQLSVGPFGLVTNNAAYSLVVSSPGATTVTVANMLIGDVWLCTGQSNMEYALGGNSSGTAMANSANEIADAKANYPNIRQFKATRGTVASLPQDVFIGGFDNGGWTTTSNAANFTAVGYLMARDIYNKLQVPIGLLNITWGGTDIIPWVPGETLRTIADYTPTVDALPGNASPGSGTATAIYNSMLAPATSFAIKGAIWYQGESSVGLGLQKYGAALAALRKGMRLKFGQPNLPFITVQICTNGPAQTVPVEAPNSGNYAEIRGAELADSLSDPTYGRTVVTIDAGFVSDATTYTANIHPINKQDPGKRAGEAALNLVYGQATPYLPPIFNHAVVEGGTMRCYFDNASNGLMVGLKPQGSLNSTPPPAVQQVSGGTLTGFAIAGADKTYYAATATIDPATNTVVVSSASVLSPVHVRYGWLTNPWNTTVPSASGSYGTPLCNLYGKITNGSNTVIDGTPASPFRSGGDAVAQLSVNGGSGSSSTYAPGQVVSVTASAAAGGTAFSKWTGDTDLLANANSASTTATLSRPYVSIRANYQITAAPTGLVGVAENQKVTLRWNAVTASSANVSYYNVKRSTLSGSGYTTIGTSYTTSYADTGLTNGTPYYYVFSAVNAVGESPNSAQITATPVPTISGLTATPSSTQVVLNWTAYSGQVNSYNVKRGTVSGGPYTPIATGLTSTTFTDTHLAAGVTYYYVISVVDNVGENPNSVATPGALNSVPPPLTATDVGTITPASQANFSAGAFTITAAGGDIYGGADSFHFVAAPISGDATIIARVSGPNSAGKAGLMMRQSLVANSAYVDTVINGGAKFEYRTTAGAGAANAGGTGTLTYPYWIKLVRVGNVFTGYVAAPATPSTWVQVGTSQTIAMSNPIYVGFAVCGQNGITRTFTFDNITAPWTYQTSAAPTGLTAVPGSTQIALNWNTSSGATGYNVKRSTAGGSYTTIATNIAAPTYMDTTATAGVTSSYIVSSINVAGEGPDSGAVGATSRPAAPGNLAASAGNGQVGLSWSATTGAASYNVKRGSNNGGPYSNIVNVSTLSYTDGGRINGTTYYYVVSALNSGGEGTDSTPASATPSLPPITSADLMTPPVTLSDGTASIALPTSIANRTYQLQRSYTLANGSWINIGSARAGGGALNFSDVPDSSESKVFYRLLLGP